MVTGKELLEDVNAIKNGKGYNPSSMKRNAAVTGGLIGFAAGVYYGYAKNQNMLVPGLLGAIVGALGARVIMPK